MDIQHYFIPTAFLAELASVELVRFATIEH
jgi:hypothetical protein